MLNVYTFTGFKGHWPVGTCAIVFATTALRAKDLLNQELEKKGLPVIGHVSEEPLLRIRNWGRCSQSEPRAEILLDGEY